MNSTVAPLRLADLAIVLEKPKVPPSLSDCLQDDDLALSALNAIAPIHFGRLNGNLITTSYFMGQYLQADNPNVSAMVRRHWDAFLTMGLQEVRDHALCA